MKTLVLYTEAQEASVIRFFFFFDTSPYYFDLRPKIWEGKQISVSQGKPVEKFSLEVNSQEDPLEKDMVAHSSILARRVP